MSSEGFLFAQKQTFQYNTCGKVDEVDLVQRAAYLEGIRHLFKVFERCNMKSSFLYQILNKLLNSMKYMNLVELFKFVGRKLAPKNSLIETRIKYSRTSVDIFIVSKWLFILILILFDVTIIWFVIAVWYLLFANLYTYFYYHTWSSEILHDRHFDATRIKRRFLTLLLAIFYPVFGFAYLYYIPYSTEFDWTDKTPNFWRSLSYSLSNSLTASYDRVKSITDVGDSISMIQLIIMFIFVTIIIGGSIPQINSDIEE